MSVRVDVKMLDQDGKFRSYITIGSTSNWYLLNDLNFVHEKLNEFMKNDLYIKDASWKYVVPSRMESYMYDLKTLELLPNRFNQ